MDTKKESSEVVGATNRASQLSLSGEGFDYKDNIKFSNPTRQRVFEEFLTGKKLSNVELSQRLRIPDPRSHIRYIRNAGIPIASYWKKTEYSKYKIYFLAGRESK